MFLSSSMDKSCVFIHFSYSSSRLLKSTPKSPVVAVSRHIYFPVCLPLSNDALRDSSRIIVRTCRNGQATLYLCQRFLKKGSD